MKTYSGFVFALLTFFLIGCQPKELPSVLTIDGEHIVFKVSHQTTKTELDSFTRELLAKNIVLDLSGTTYLKEGTLQQLKFAVMLADGTIGTKSADLVGLQYRYYGFEYNPKSTIRFRAGSFE